MGDRSVPFQASSDPLAFPIRTVLQRPDVVSNLQSLASTLLEHYTLKHATWISQPVSFLRPHLIVIKWLILLIRFKSNEYLVDVLILSNVDPLLLPQRRI